MLSVFRRIQHERAVIETLKHSTGDQTRTFERLRLRRIPNLHYTFDRTEAEAADIENF